MLIYRKPPCICMYGRFGCEEVAELRDRNESDWAHHAIGGRMSAHDAVDGAASWDPTSLNTTLRAAMTTTWSAVTLKDCRCARPPWSRLSIALFHANLASGCAFGLGDMNIVRATTFSLSFLLLAVASAQAQTSPRAPRDFISWLHQFGRVGAQHPRAHIGAHQQSPPLPRARPVELTAVAPRAEAASAAPNTAQSEAAHERARPTSPAAADNTRATVHASPGPASADMPNAVQFEPALPAATNKARPAVLIND